MAARGWHSQLGVVREQRDLGKGISVNVRQSVQRHRLPTRNTVALGIGKPSRAGDRRQTSRGSSAVVSGQNVNGSAASCRPHLRAGVRDPTGGVF